MPSDPVALAKNLAMLSELRLKRASLKVGGGGGGVTEGGPGAAAEAGLSEGVGRWGSRVCDF